MLGIWSLTLLILIGIASVCFILSSLNNSDEDSELIKPQEPDVFDSDEAGLPIDQTNSKADGKKLEKGGMELEDQAGVSEFIVTGGKKQAVPSTNIGLRESLLLKRAQNRAKSIGGCKLEMPDDDDEDENMMAQNFKFRKNRVESIGGEQCNPDEDAGPWKKNSSNSVKLAVPSIVIRKISVGGADMDCSPANLTPPITHGGDTLSPTTDYMVNQMLGPQNDKRSDTLESPSVRHMNTAGLETINLQYGRRIIKIAESLGNLADVLNSEHVVFSFKPTFTITIPVDGNLLMTLEKLLKKGLELNSSTEEGVHVDWRTVLNVYHSHDKKLENKTSALLGQLEDILPNLGLENLFSVKFFEDTMVIESNEDNDVKIFKELCRFSGSKKIQCDQSTLRMIKEKISRRYESFGSQSDIMDFKSNLSSQTIEDQNMKIKISARTPFNSFHETTSSYEKSSVDDEAEEPTYNAFDLDSLITGSVKKSATIVEDEKLKSCEKNLNANDYKLKSPETPLLVPNARRGDAVPHQSDPYRLPRDQFMNEVKNMIQSKNIEKSASSESPTSIMDMSKKSMNKILSKFDLDTFTPQVTPTSDNILKVGNPQPEDANLFPTAEMHIQ